MIKSVVIALLVCVILQEIQIIFLQRKLSQLEEIFASFLMDKVQKIFVHLNPGDEDDEEDTGA